MALLANSVRIRRFAKLWHRTLKLSCRTVSQSTFEGFAAICVPMMMTVRSHYDSRSNPEIPASQVKDLRQHAACIFSHAGSALSPGRRGRSSANAGTSAGIDAAQSLAACLSAQHMSGCPALLASARAACSAIEATSVEACSHATSIPIGLPLL